MRTAGRRVVIERARPDHAAGGIANEVSDPGLFDDTGAGGTSPIEKNVVEDPTANREPSIAKPAEAMSRGEVSANPLAVRGANHHSAELCRSARLDDGERPHGVEDAGRLGAEILRARLVARKARAIHHDDIDSAAGEEQRGRSPRRSSADDHDI
jgi:hypothetical protein